MLSKNLTITTESADYPIYINNSFASLPQAFYAAELTHRRVLVVADTNTARLFGKVVATQISGFSENVEIFTTCPGESAKSISVACEIYHKCIEMRLDRTSVIVALGGGVIGDLAGFAASTFMRGVAFVQIPTTLLAQVDSSVGGKVAVNFDGNKNTIGTFYQPRFVYSNIMALTSLLRSEFISGIAEAIKHGLICDEDYLSFIMQNKESISRLDYESVARLVCRSCEIKADIVRMDEREKGVREILNFGHTFGHGIEAVSRFSIPHGHAVATGCIAALAVSKKKGNITDLDLFSIKSLFEYFGLPCCIEGYSAANIFEHMKRDKKSKSGVMTLILLRRVGEAYSDATRKECDIHFGLDAIIA